MNKNKYTHEELKNAVQLSTSYAGVLKKLCIKQGGGNQAYLKNKIKSLNIDTTHFLGKGSNQGTQHVGGPKKLSPEDIFIFDRLDGRKERSRNLRLAMLEVGFLNKCSICGLTDNWNGKPLRLEVDHIDGNFVNNVVTNLRFVCPNCHSQLPTSSSHIKQG